MFTILRILKESYNEHGITVMTLKDIAQKTGYTEYFIKRKLEELKGEGYVEVKVLKKKGNFLLVCYIPPSIERELRTSNVITALGEKLKRLLDKKDYKGFEELMEDLKVVIRK